jgi:ribosomal protein S18 acetylase RimI-like enzyme
VSQSLEEILTVEFRVMHKNDYPEALSLWRSLPGLGLSGADEESQIHKFLDENPNTCFVAVNNKKVVGTVLGGNDGRRGYIYHLAVDLNYQRSGIGKSLVERCLDSLRSAGLQKCHIFVIRDNAEGIRFWENAGWTQRDDILVMSMNL